LYLLAVSGIHASRGISAVSHDVQEPVEGCEAEAEAYGKGEVELTLGDQRHVYRLPKCKTAGLVIHNPNKVELILDTEGDHRLVIELDSKGAETLNNLLELTFKSAHGR
jgi:hypothetical protein